MKKFFSFSEGVLWHKDRAEYLRRYVEGKEVAATREQLLGTLIHEGIADPHFPIIEKMKEAKFPVAMRFKARKILNNVTRFPEREKMFVGNLPDKFGGEAIGAVFDGLDSQERRLGEYKTTAVKEAWSQWRVDRNPQLSFYAGIWWCIYRSFFREMVLYRIDVNGATIKKYMTARGPADIQEAFSFAAQTISEMKRAGIWEKRLSYRERTNLKLL